jgi:hypothetical protein
MVEWEQDPDPPRHFRYTCHRAECGVYGGPGRDLIEAAFKWNALPRARR